MATTEREYPIWKVITASAAGTMIEWYDFYLFGSLATIMAGVFFPKGGSRFSPPSPPSAPGSPSGRSGRSCSGESVIWSGVSTPFW